MGPFSFFRSIYALDTLDTRFTTSSNTPYKSVIESRNSKKETPQKPPHPGAEPPKWRTPEFFLYYLIVAVTVPAMFWVAYNVSRPSDPRYYKFGPWLHEGWIPGRRIDISDTQYRTFRRNLPYMALLLVFHPLLRRLWNLISPIPSTRSPSPVQRSSPSRATPEDGDARLRQRTSYDAGFAILFLFILHGFSAPKALAILWLNYQLATGLPRQYVPVATWVFNIGVLFSNELCSGYSYKSIALFISPAADTLSAEEGFFVIWGQWLDSHGGLIPRWQILFNITVLRLISFNLDYYWSYDRRGGSPLEKQLDPTNLSERDRVAIPAQSHDFCFRNYIAYAIYAPLYLVGPILTFNDYISQAKFRPASIEVRRTIKYAIRFALVFLSMEVLLHYVYVTAISQAGPVWSDYTAAQLSLLSYFNLHIIWLKLLLPWRLFRLWALVDGIDPPENMLRCVSNNYSTLSFWRAWHRSYNRWLIRYIYVPLGGASFRSWAGTARSIVTYVVVFTFVALWHDIKLRLLIWGWLVVLFFMPEVAAKFIFPKRKFEGRDTMYRMLSCAGAVANVLMMMMANLVGFAVGFDGLQSIIQGIWADYYGMFFLIVACFALFVGIQIMFEIRQSELRKGIHLKC